MWVPGSSEMGMKSYYLMSIEFQFYQKKRVLEMDGGDGRTTV